MKHIVFDCDGTLVDTSISKSPLFPGIRELIIDLARDNLLYVWTARDRTSTLRILQENGVYQYFDAFATISDVPPKPSIVGLQRLVGNVPRSSVCVIGDSSSDIIGGKGFGVLSIGAIWGQGASALVLKDSGADFIVSHPSECSKLIEQNLKGDDHVR